MIAHLVVATSLIFSQAENRPNEADLFGSANDAVIVDAGTVVAPVEQSRDGTELSGPQSQNKFDSQEVKSDPLKVGGTVYIRSSASLSLGQSPEDMAFSAPSLMDVYLDARPNDRIRGMAVGRINYNPTLASPNSSAALDQLWLRFDVARKVFLTVGRQKIRWGVSKIWLPTDFLNTQPKDPLAPFDQRLGSNMIKIHLPVESLGWNFYAYTLLDNAGPANTLGNIGAALRAEFVVKQTEFSLGGVWVKGRKPRYAFDISSALGPIDIYGEVAFRDGSDFVLQRFRTASFDATIPLADNFESYQLSGLRVLASGGVSYTFNLTDSATVSMGAEYFFNPVGYSSPAIYGWLLYQQQFNFFYTGKHYVGLFATIPQFPGFNTISMSLFNLVNASDLSGIIRYDIFFRVLTYLQVEAFIAANYGTPGGEFHFKLDLASVAHIPAPVGSAGLGLRLSI